ncbi:MAG: AAA family ATPase [Saprospiraceae bacterium]|nr:AAA family ATPase [Saprospiraceae bacterium]
MRIKKISFKNFRLFENLEIEFPEENFIVLIGSNGSGKTTILDGIAKCLEHFVGILTTVGENGHNIYSSLSEEDIRLGNQTTTIDVDLESFENVFSFQSSKNRNLAGTAYKIQDEKLLKEKRKKIESGEIKTYPVLGYLDINRSANIKKIIRPNILSPLLSEVYDTITLDMSNFSFVNDWYVAASTEESFIRSNERKLDFELDSLKHIRQAFLKFTNHLDTHFEKVNVQIREGLPYQPESKSTFFFGINKGDTVLNFNQLSSGEKSIINIVFSIAQKLIKANRSSENPLDGKGLILIDEIDLHLHPSWQVKIVKALKTTFPNVQFIVTTHSPLVLSGVRKEEIISLTAEGVIPNDEIPDIYGASAEEIYDKLLFSDAQIAEYKEDKRKIDDAIILGKYDDAERLITDLKLKIKSSPKWLLDYKRRVAFAKA